MCEHCRTALDRGPCPIKHLDWPDREHSARRTCANRFHLMPSSYHPRDLLENTVKYFRLAGHCLTDLQISARDDLARLLNQPRDPGSRRSLRHSDLLDSTMTQQFETIARLLDDFFFFGLLCGYTNVIIKKDSEITWPPGMAPCLGYKVRAGNYTKQTPYTTCVIIDNGRQTVASGLDTLVHELVHAYLDVFSCSQGSCYENRLSYGGAGGHGPVFTCLHASIVLTIRTWHKDLAHFHEDMDEHGFDEDSNFIDLSDTAAWLKHDHQVQFRRRLAEDESRSVCMVENKLLIKHELLRDAQIVAERAWKNLPQPDHGGPIVPEKRPKNEATATNPYAMAAPSVELPARARWLIFMFYAAALTWVCFESST